MSFSNNTESNLLKLMFNGTTWANVADNASSSPSTGIGVSLATGDPGEGGTMSTSEVTYSGYARVTTARSTASSGWLEASGTVNPVSNIDFTVGSSTAGGTPVVTHFSVGKPGGGAVDIFLSGTVTPNITTGSGVTPRLTTATAVAAD
jgi:hypothetical protein